MKIMLIGPSAAGKTTLIQRLIDEEIKYDKTQAVEYIGNFIDTRVNICSRGDTGVL